MTDRDYIPGTESQSKGLREAFLTAYSNLISSAYVCIAYRYGHREGHSYVVDITEGIDTAKQVAEKEVIERGGKYSVVVFSKNHKAGIVEEIYTAKCPEYYTNATEPSTEKGMKRKTQEFTCHSNFSVAYDKFKLTTDYDRALRMLINLGMKMPYADNWIHSIFSAGWGDQKIELIRIPIDPAKVQL